VLTTEFYRKNKKDLGIRQIEALKHVLVAQSE
jgi:hypothetical protein